MDSLSMDGVFSFAGTWNPSTISWLMEEDSWLPVPGRMRATVVPFLWRAASVAACAGLLFALKSLRRSLMDGRATEASSKPYPCVYSTSL